MRAVALHPFTEAEHSCPHCGVRLEVKGWHVPGMRNLADLLCPSCGRDFYGDLAAGQALYTPMLLEKTTGVVHDSHGVEWFADWLRNSYARRLDESLPFEVIELRTITRPVVILNCLDTLYGHALLKLLNAQHHLERHSDVDLVVMVPSLLAWMVPDGVAQVWSVGLPLRRGTEWNEWLAREVRRRVEAFGRVSLSHALSHPRPDEYDIERFTRVEPFPLEAWDARLLRPTVTFIWRDDRPWSAPNISAARSRRERFKRWLNSPPRPSRTQAALVSELAEELRRSLPALDFAVVGLSKEGASGGLPEWVRDLRRPAFETAADERALCARYAASHVVVGVHGSNLLLPSAHAGSVVELLGPERWGNFTQATLFRDSSDCRETLFRYRFVDESTTPHALARLVKMMLTGRASFRRLMNVL